MLAGPPDATSLGLSRYRDQTYLAGYDLEPVIGKALLTYGCKKMIRSVLSRLCAQSTWRGRVVIVLLALILVSALATGEGNLYRLSYFLALAIASCYAWAWLNLLRVGVWVDEQSPAAQVGDTLDGFIYVHNDSALPTGWLEIEQVSDMPGHVCQGATRLPARGWERWKTEMICYARGAYTVGPLVVRSSDPLGLFRVQRSRGTPVEVMIYPPVVPLPRFRVPAAELSGEQGLLHRRRVISPSVGTVRQYEHGDSLNRIHWPSTAKFGELMSKDFDSGRSSDLWVIVDLQREICRSTGTESTDEYAVSIAASVANIALSEECSVGLIAYGDREHFLPLGNGATQMSRMLEMLAVSKTEGEVPLHEILSESVTRLSRFTSLLVITSSTVTEWASVVEDLTYRGLVIGVVLIDPMSFGADESSHEVSLKLVGAGIPVYVVKSGDALGSALTRPISMHELLTVQ